MLWPPTAMGLLAWIASLYAASVILTRGADAQFARWSIVERGDATATAWDSELIEICAFEQLHARLEASVHASVIKALRQETKTFSSEGIQVPLEIVQLDDLNARHVENVVSTTSVPLRALLDEERDNDQSVANSAPSPSIECAFDTLFCMPKIVGIRLPDVVTEGQTLSANHSIVLQFADATNRPLASTKDEIEAFVVFPAYVGDELEGVWTDDRTLVIVVKTMDSSMVLPQHELMSALVHTIVRSHDESTKTHDPLIRVQLEVRLRVEPPGRFVIRPRLMDDSFPESPQFLVRSCDEASDSTAVLVLADDTITAVSRSSPDMIALPKPSVRVDGVLSHSGDEAFTLGHVFIKVRDPGSWSLNFWLFTNQDATGEFRTLFFNGDGFGQHRTPSAWFRPNDRRLVLRVSTITDMDVGLDSTREIPLGEWVNVGFSFRNCSTGIEVNSTVRDDCAIGDAKPYFYSVQLFINGVLDQDMRIFTPVLPNDGPLHLAKGPWTHGMKGFTSHIQVFDHNILGEAHKTIYVQGRRGLYRLLSAGECEAFALPDSFSSITKAPFHPVRQILYLTRCFERKLSTDNSDSFGISDGIADEDTVAKSLYDDSGRLLNQCAPSAWDVLVEAAELGDIRALHDVGKALLYGLHPYPETCALSRIDGVRVEPDSVKAKLMLERSLRRGWWDAAQHLALFYTVGSPTSSPVLAGLYHLAAAAGHREAFMVLGRMYSTGRNLQAPEMDVSGYHYFHAASEASITFHSRGKEPLHEMNRLYDGGDKEDELRKGQLGDDDNLIQYQKMRADKDGDVEAMANMGDLYYWGARGVHRDHEQAFHYFRRAAERDHTSAQAAVAGMFLKGEGTKQDNESAIRWYEKAAQKNNTRALNGLGFVYFYGSGGKTENKTMALQLFERAAANMEDGDSIFNAGYCHVKGLGTKPNITRAMHYYDTAARKFGHFDAIHELGKAYWNGGRDIQGGFIVRNSAFAVPYIRAASEAGPWGATVRTGFELFLAGEFERAAVRYHEASEYGYSVATSNLAYLYDQKLLRTGDKRSEARALEYLRRAWELNADKETLVRIGDHHFYGLGHLIATPSTALRWYSRASAEGVEAGAYNVGHMHEYGLGVPVNYDRAERYYKRVLDLAPPQALDRQIAVQLTLLRLQLRRLFEGSIVATYLSQPASSSSVLPVSEDNAQQNVSVAISVILAAVVVAIGAWVCKLRAN